MNRMPLQFGSIPFIRRQGIQYEIGFFRLHPFGEQVIDIPDLGYPAHGDIQFRGGSEKMSHMAIGMEE
jgi:hypothetical protein